MYIESHCVEYYINTLWTENMLPSLDADTRINSTHRLSSFIKMVKISFDDFTFQFENLQYAEGRNETWLCQIVSVNGGEPDLQVFKNGYSGHAEETCLRNSATQGADQYEITWFMSWSPCERCTPQIITFVEQQRNVKLNIFVSRLFRYDSEPHRQGLRALSQQERIGLKVMTLKEFQECFDRFVGEGNGFQDWKDLAGNSAIHTEKLNEITGADPRLVF
ncbi:DNA dC-_dU-editing enzyme APOBEC-3C-like isoform X2 [Polyodon spathula]|uniref:DNA dC->dU-editing enzyme APOBEC-3C-like isoform X2 n=1 Tax=Polyodon spathula TaxID=7913 RepID=UPI001B7F5D22|nr:DNA dC->dU-editing enzyme APOBEC-3C-like isoform X2 [Polyodon spathula]